ncbi:MAG: hypothetical protein RR960_06975 [Alistipes sp.]
MKYTKYILILVIALLSFSCSKDDTNDIDPVIKSEREALLATTNIGFYQNGKSYFLFNKMAHQVVINPAQLRFRIQDDAGEKYAEIQLSAFPEADKTVKATITGNLLKGITLENVMLLRYQNKQLTLWCDAAHMGIILPWIEKK